MEQVKAVPLPYEPRPTPKPILKKKALRQSNRHRFDGVLVCFLQFVLYVVIPLFDARMRQPRIFTVISTLWMLHGVMQSLDILRRYQLAASQWMARPGERRILKYGVVLRVLGVMPSRVRLSTASTRYAADSEPVAQFPEQKLPKPVISVHSSDGYPTTRVRKRYASRAAPSPVSRRLQQLLGLGLLTLACIAYFKDFQPGQHPVSSAFGFLLVTLFAAEAISLLADLGVACWRACTAAGRSHISQSWIEYWKLRVESFEMPRKNAGASNQL